MGQIYPKSLCFFLRSFFRFVRGEYVFEYDLHEEVLDEDQEALEGVIGSGIDFSIL